MPGAPAPKAGVVAGLDLTGYATTPAIPTPTVDGRIEREVVLIEWTDRNPANATFEGTARELLRLQHPLPQHPLGEMTFNPVARQGDPDWRVMYLGAGDSGSGDQRDSRRINPQRLDTLVGKILRIVPDLREHAATSTVSENGRYRIPNDNPFTTLDGARKEIWAYGLRNPHRLIWDVDPARPKEPRLLAFHIGLVSWETVVVIRKGANYGWPLREGTQARSLEGMGPIPADDTIPIQISDTVDARHGQADVSGAAVSAPARRRRRHRQWLHLSRQADPGAEGQARVRRHHDRPDLVRGSRRPPRGGRWQAGDAGADSRDGDGAARPRGAVPTAHAAAKARRCPAPRRSPAAAAWTCGSPIDDAGELYVLTKPDGMIRKVVGATRHDGAPAATAPARQRRSTGGLSSSGIPARRPRHEKSGAVHAGLDCRRQGRLRGHVRRLPRPPGAGRGEGGLTISIIEEQRGKQPPDLTDAQWDHGSSDGEIFAVMKRGVPSTMMPGFDGALSDSDMWNIVNYLRTLHSREVARHLSNTGSPGRMTFDQVCR